MKKWRCRERRRKTEPFTPNDATITNHDPSVLINICNNKPPGKAHTLQISVSLVVEILGEKGREEGRRD